MNQSQNEWVGRPSDNETQSIETMELIEWMILINKNIYVINAWMMSDSDEIVANKKLSVCNLLFVSLWVVISVHNRGSTNVYISYHYKVN